MSACKSIDLSSGYSIPQVGLGTWLSNPGEVGAAVKAAVEVGYRHIDCAFVYGNEEEIGKTLKELFNAGTVKREELFITSKLWNTFHSHDSIKKGLELSLQRLGLGYLDLFLIHWPIAFQEGEDVFPRDEEGKPLTTDTDYLETWKGMEDLLDTGLVRSIGISNFNQKQVQRLLDNCRVKPAMLQNEIHPHMPCKDLIEFCHSKGIAVTAYSSLGNSGVPDFVNTKKLKLMEDPHVLKIAEKHKKGPNHVLLRYAMDQNLCVIPKSVNPERIKDNFNVFDFTLDKEDFEQLSNFEESRVVPMANAFGHKYHPFATGDN
jgi:aldehyde reductase